MTGHTQRSTARQASVPARTWLLFGSLYTTQYIGLAFGSIALAALLREHGASLGQLAMLNLIALPVVFKFLWVPLVDHCGRSRSGHYRNWLLPTQLAMVVLLLSMGQFDPVKQTVAVVALFMALATVTATQDLALDGLACTTIPEDRRHLLNSIQTGGGLLGNCIGGGLMLVLLPWLGWRGALIVLAGLVLLAWLQLWGLRERIVARGPSRRLRHGWQQLWRFWRGRKGLLVLLMLYPAGFSAALPLLTPMLVDGGWPPPRIGMVVKIYGAAIGLLSALLGAWMLRRAGRKRSVVASTFVFALCLLPMFLPALGHVQTHWVYLAVGAYFLGFSPLYASLMAVMMDQAAESELPATVFTLQNALSMLSGYAAAALTLWVAQWFGYAAAIALLIGVSLASCLLAMRVLADERRAP